MASTTLSISSFPIPIQQYTYDPSTTLYSDPLYFPARGAMSWFRKTTLYIERTKRVIHRLASSAFVLSRVLQKYSYRYSLLVIDINIE
ncbi:hypothetical protein QTP88_022388 [Uroleucon formosanum]